MSLLEETNASGVVQADYIYLNGGTMATLDPSTGALYFMHDDSLGTPQLATDSSQTIAWQATYQPFGQASVSGTITQNLRFPGQYFDSESGWNHNGFRNYIPDLGRYAEPDPLALQGTATFYDPITGRLISEDPTVFRAEDDFYPYVDNTPVNDIDPLGLVAGPKNPRVGTRCTWTDSCSQLKGKIQLLEKTLYSHMGWDWALPSPRGGTRHSKEISDFLNALARCLNIQEKKCKQNCQGSPAQQPTPQPNPPVVTPLPINPIIPDMPIPMPMPMPMPEPIPILIG